MTNLLLVQGKMKKQAFILSATGRWEVSKMDETEDRMNNDFF